MRYEFTAVLWKYQGEAAWYFVNIPKEYSDEVKELTKGITSGFKSVKVKVDLGSSSWRTSVFPDKKLGCYLLPIKKSVRLSENIDDGSKLKIIIEILGL